jgi:hypothetical protein
MIAAGGVAALALPPLLRELGTAALVVVAAVGALRGRPALPTAAVMLVLGLASVAAFAERLPPFATPQPVLATADRIGDAARAARPALAGSLTRVRLDAEVPGLHANTAFAAGMSSLDGYAIPTRRFAALVFALNGQPYNPTANIFQFKAAEPAFPVLRQLYNVGDAVALAPDGRVVVSPLGPTAGPAWFSASVVTVGDVATLARELGAAGETLHVRAREVVWRDGTDPRVAAVAIPALGAGCRDARVSAVRAPRRGPAIVAETVTAAACPLTFAANFTDDLRAAAVLADGRRVDVPVFPAYGALAGVLAPGGATAIHLRAEPVRLPWAAVWVALGLACCAAAAWLARRE